MAEKEGPKMGGRETNVVAQDEIWRKYVANELRSADELNENWGFLTKDGRGKYSITISRQIQTRLSKALILIKFF